MADDKREQALIRHVEARQRERCREILEEARVQAQEIVRDAFAEARQRVSGTIAEERELVRRRIRESRARLATLERLRTQRRHAELLTRAEVGLSQALEARWQDAQGRERWVRNVVSQALEVLPRGQWELWHGELWDEATAEAVREQTAERSDIDVRFETKEHIQVGLCVCHEGVVLDATLEGLLAHRDAVRERLLAHLTAVHER